MGILKIENIGVNDDVMVRISNGVMKNKMNALRVLCISKNNIT